MPSPRSSARMALALPLTNCRTRRWLSGSKWSRRQGLPWLKSHPSSLALRLMGLTRSSPRPWPLPSTVERRCSWAGLHYAPRKGTRAHTTETQEQNPADCGEAYRLQCDSGYLCVEMVVTALISAAVTGRWKTWKSHWLACRRCQRTVLPMMPCRAAYRRACSHAHLRWHVIHAKAGEQESRSIWIGAGGRYWMVVGLVTDSDATVDVLKTGFLIPLSGTMEAGNSNACVKRVCGVILLLDGGAGAPTPV
mmetsp:Transcript_57043/g.116749  ORF Transcript_57043/g.116749 Transcript_57043/m.116749 type:complete len:250 (+) Transcript_57043:1447-2196(+)